MENTTNTVSTVITALTNGLSTAGSDLLGGIASIVHFFRSPM